MTLVLCSDTLHTIVVDCGTIGFFDAGGVNTLTQVSQSILLNN